MSLLDDFNGICEAQDNSIEMKLHKFAQQDKEPNVYSLNEINQICYVSHLSGKPTNPIEILEPNKIYIICNTSVGLAINLLNTSLAETLEAYKNQYLIGAKEEGFISLSWEDITKYISTYKVTWGEDLGDELNYKIWEKSLKNNYYDMDTTGCCSNDGSRTFPFHPITMKVDYSKDMFNFI